MISNLSQEIVELNNIFDSIIGDFEPTENYNTIPEYIKMISDEQFVDVYFNHVKGGNSMIADYVEKLQQNYDVVVENIDTVIRKYKAGFKNGIWSFKENSCCNKA